MKLVLACYFLSEPYAYIESVVDKIVGTTEAYAHEALLSIIDALWGESVCYSMCKQMATSCQRNWGCFSGKGSHVPVCRPHPAGMREGMSR